MDQDSAVNHFAEADHQLAEAQLRIATQKATIDGLRRDGHDTRRSSALLALFEASLEKMLEHRGACYGNSDALRKKVNG